MEGAGRGLAGEAGELHFVEAVWVGLDARTPLAILAVRHEIESPNQPVGIESASDLLSPFPSHQQPLPCPPPDAGLYTEADLDASLERTHVINFQQTLCVNGIGITAYRAGHVLGAAMFMVEIAGQRILYTGEEMWRR